ncbi:MAG: hypothetical protein UT05_C0011G0019 [Parcubacteria group bacterium GW2011_GWF2_38_76]|nr:MAG: hypothetical protein UT05_C0011G0019 [Parcubacteria group bacterium GW2011_GWF2_38_76]HBM45375.1 hypothetical protein [Patescibacteria group bacterium]
MNTLLHLLARAIALMVTAFILPGITLTSFWIAIVLAVVLSALNIFVKPIILLLTLPINLITLGLFTLVINAFIIMIASSLVPGFYVGGFMLALMFSIVLAIVNMALEFFV